MSSSADEPTKLPIDAVPRLSPRRSRSEHAMIVAIDHVQLAMPPGGEARARDFYWGALGFDEVAKPAELAGRGGCWFEKGGVRVHLGVEPGFQPARKAHPAFRVKDLALLLAACRERGYAAYGEDQLDGVYRAYIDDPFGNRIELIEAP